MKSRRHEGVEFAGFAITTLAFLFLGLFGTFGGAPNRGDVSTPAAERSTDPRTTPSSVVGPGKVGASRRAGGGR